MASDLHKTFVCFICAREEGMAIPPDTPWLLPPGWYQCFYAERELDEALDFLVEIGLHQRTSPHADRPRRGVRFTLCSELCCHRFGREMHWLLTGDDGSPFSQRLWFPPAQEGQDHDHDERNEGNERTGPR